MITTQQKEARKARVLEAIARLTETQGFPPSYRDLAQEVGMAHSAAYLLVESLRTDGLINERPTKPWLARSITLTNAGRAAISHR